MAQYEIGYLFKQKNTNACEDKVVIDTDNLSQSIRAIASRCRWVIMVVMDYQNTSRYFYYKYTGEAVFYFPKLQKYITEEEYQTWKTKNTMAS